MSRKKLKSDVKEHHPHKVVEVSETERRRLEAQEAEDAEWRKIDEKFKDDPLYDPKRARLYDMAQKAQHRGDDESYRGYMSALGDIGR